MKKLFLLTLFLLATIALLGCQSTQSKFTFCPNGPIKMNAETGQSWIFANGYWLPIREIKEDQFIRRMPGPSGPQIR